MKRNSQYKEETEWLVLLGDERRDRA